jgi:arylsulfatase A-like enzyme
MTSSPHAKNRVRRAGLCAAAGLLVAACGGGSSEPRPSVLLLTLDTTRADYLSCYGSTRSKTPALDGLAQSGALFENAMAASAVTPVAHASILTGRFAPGHGLRVLAGGGGDRLSADVPSLARAFGEAGWATGAVHSAFPVSRRFGLDQGFQHFDSFDGKARIDETGKTTWDVQNLQRRSDETVDRTLAWVAEQDDPFFLWVHLWDPHDPTLVPPDEFVAGVPQNEQGAYHPIRLYAREVEYLDLQIGRLLEGLRAEAGEPGLVVAVTSDHGEGLDDGMVRHGWGAHRMLYREQVHVPLILAGPGVPPSTRVSAQVRTVDLAPTLAELVGLPFGGSLDGHSLSPMWLGVDAADRVAYADQVNGYDGNASMVRRRPDAAFQFVWVEQPWKLYWRPHDPAKSELFHLGEDPIEGQNRLATEPEVARRLLTDLAALEPWVTEPYAPPADIADAAGALGALGYGGGDGEAAEYPWVRVPLSEALGLEPRAGEPEVPIVRH